MKKQENGSREPKVVITYTTLKEVITKSIKTGIFMGMSSDINAETDAILNSIFNK